jgi:hypothetical protein
MIAGVCIRDRGGKVVREIPAKLSTIENCVLENTPVSEAKELSFVDLIEG